MSGAVPKACNILHQVFKLQDERAISAYLFKCGLDDQDPQNWDDIDTLHAEGLGIADVEVLSPDEQEGDGDQQDEMEVEEKEEEAEKATAVLKIPSPIPPSSSEEEEVTESDERASNDAVIKHLWA